MRKLKIRKVDDKPMVIHTKEKAKRECCTNAGKKTKWWNTYGWGRRLCENLWQHQGYKKIEADEADRSFQNDFRDALQEIGISSDRTMHISISSAGEVRVTGLSDEKYRLAGYVEELDRFLNKVSNGNVTVDDLWCSGL